MAQLLALFRHEAVTRPLPDEVTPSQWHADLYLGCAVPVPGYVGHYRVDATVPELDGYEVGVGALLSDGCPEKVGVPSRLVADEVGKFVAGARAALLVLDRAVPPGARPASPQDVRAVVQVAAIFHGEWVRIHPFANGNGRTARLWANHVALRYGLPAFVSVKPRPHGVDYARAGRESMGRPPDFQGDGHVAATAVFTSMLAAALSP